MSVFKYLSKKLKISCALVIVLAITGSVIASIWPVLLSEIYDGISIGTIFSFSTAAIPIILFGIAFLSSEICSIVRRVWVDKISASFEKHLRDTSIQKLLRLPTKFYNDNISGEYTAKINQSVAGASQLVKTICNNIVPSVFISIFTIVQVIRKAPLSISAILMSYIILEVFVSVLQIKSQKGIREMLISKKAKLDGTICQSIQNIEMIRVTNAECYEFKRIEPLTENIRGTESKHHSYMGMFDLIKQVLKVTYTIFILAFSIWLVSKGTMSSGMVITVILLFQQLVVPIDTVHVFMDEMSSSIIKAKEFVKLISEKEDEIFDKDLEDVDIPAGDIKIDNLTVYTPDKQIKICSGKSFTIKAGTVTSLNGPTGSGKSSLVKGIMRYYPSDGEIFVDKGGSIRTVSQKALCNAIYNMVQQPIFFAGSLKENLTYGLDYMPSEEQMMFALKNALIYEELKAKSNDILGIFIAEGGGNLSGGQRQRLALARAFLRQPLWFFIDEATANIDDDTTDMVFDNLKNYAKSINAGILCISHQKNIIAKCDQVINLTTNKVA